ncbi:MAG: zinc ribbon domain-containing protein [Clostridiales bacterium]|jgi:hypothetical protein|nr:zinc ribbon domain-containing protein [Clostridiales bacterium]
MYCRSCGTQIDDDSRFCEKCGTEVNSAEPFFEDDGPYEHDSRHERERTYVHGDIPRNFSTLPVFGIIGAILLVVSLMTILYTYSFIAGLHSNLQAYSSQIDGDTLIERVGGDLLDLFTGGAATQKRDELQRLDNDIKLGRNIMTGGLFCAALALLTSVLGVLRNIRKPISGRGFFGAAFIASIICPILVFISSMLLYIVNFMLLITLTCNVIAIILFIVETARIRALRISFFKKREPRPRRKAREN